MLLVLIRLISFTVIFLITSFLQDVIRSTNSFDGTFVKRQKVMLPKTTFSLMYSLSSGTFALSIAVRSDDVRLSMLELANATIAALLGVSKKFSISKFNALCFGTTLSKIEIEVLIAISSNFGGFAIVRTFWIVMCNDSGGYKYCHGSSCRSA